MKRSQSPAPPPKGEKKPVLGYLLVNTVLMLAIYYACIYFGFEYIFHIYVAIGLVMAFAYVIYNRGMAGRHITPDMLPEAMTDAEKDAFIQGVKERMQKSRWVLTLLLPVIVTIAVDTFYMLVLKEFFA